MISSRSSYFHCVRTSAAANSPSDDNHGMLFIRKWNETKAAAINEPYILTSKFRR